MLNHIVLIYCVNILGELTSFPKLESLNGPSLSRLEVFSVVFKSRISQIIYENL